MRSVYPGDKNFGVRLNTWKKHKFWPEAATAEIRETWETFSASFSEGIEQDKAELEAVKTVLNDYPHASEALDIWKRCGVWSAESVGHSEEDSDVPGMSKAQPSGSEATSGMTDKGEGLKTGQGLLRIFQVCLRMTLDYPGKRLWLN